MDSDVNKKVINKVTEVINFMGKSNLAEIELETNEFKMKLKKHGKIIQQVIEPATSNIAPTITEPNAVATQSANATNNISQPIVAEENFNKVCAPMAGTFYAAPSPTSPPYVKENDNINQGDTLCIVEAMKMMNEIKSEFSGKIIKILGVNGEPVEKGDVLFHII